MNLIRMHGFLKKLAYHLIKAAMPIMGVQLRRKLIKYWLRQKDMVFMVKSLCANESEEVSLKDELMSNDVISFSDYQKKIIHIHKEKISRILDPARKTIAFYLPTCAYRGNLGNIASRLKDKGFNVLTLIGTVCDDKYEKRGQVFYGGLGITKYMDFVDVFITPTQSLNMPENVKKVLFMHDIHDSPIDPEMFLSKVLLFDYMFLPSEFVIERMRQLVMEPKNKSLEEIVKSKTKEICLIRGGYIKLDKNIEYFQKHKSNAKVIIYAPTVIGYEFEDIVSLPHYGERIIGAILREFSDYELIFRPHPHTLHTGYVLNILKKYKGHSKLTFDDNAGFYMDNYSKSALMITDSSGTAYTYAFTTLRPVVFFSHNEKAVNERYKHLRFFQDRNKVGYVVENINDMVEKTRLLLRGTEVFEASIREYRESSIYNIGKSEDYFVENFEYIVENEKHKEWEYI